MKTRLPTAAVLASLVSALLAPSMASGQNVYRCANGYSQSPCAPDAAPMQVSDPRTAEQKRQADAATQRDARMADALEKERLQRDAAAVPAAGVKQVKSSSKTASAQSPGTGKAASKKSGAKSSAKKAGKSGEPFVATDGKKKAKAGKKKSRGKTQGTQKAKGSKKSKAAKGTARKKPSGSRTAA